MCHPLGDLYEIKVKEPLDPSWSEWFDDFTITISEGGEAKIVGFIIDQTALHGLLAKIRDLNLTLVSVRKIAAGGGSGQEKRGRAKIKKRKRSR